MQTRRLLKLFLVYSMIWRCRLARKANKESFEAARDFWYSLMKPTVYLSTLTDKVAKLDKSVNESTELYRCWWMKTAWGIIISINMYLAPTCCHVFEEYTKSWAGCLFNAMLMSCLILSHLVISCYILPHLATSCHKNPEQVAPSAQCGQLDAA
jgi:hypothetical protein